MLWQKLKLLEHDHTGRLRPHEHTSYGPLALLLMVAIIPLIAITASAKTPYDGPEAGSVGLSGVMPGKPPTIAATITSPASGTRTTVIPVTIKGTCPANLLVEIFKSDIFAGSTTCTSSGAFQMDIDLLIGKNDVVARVYDALNQPGPDSNIVVLHYDALPNQSGPLASLDFGGVQLLINTDAVFRGVFPNKEMSMPLQVIGGTPPYAVNIQWGDAENSVIPRNDNQQFRVAHTYKKPGVYQITIQATDSFGRIAFMQVAAIVNGQPDVAQTATTTTATTVNSVLVLWPLYVGIAGMLLAFWLGEKREKHILKKRGQLLPI